MNKPQLNREWHETHVLGSHAPMDQRVTWHLEHAQVCGCVPISLKMRHEIVSRGLTPPDQAPPPR